MRRWTQLVFASFMLLLLLFATPLLSSASGASLKDRLAQKQAELNAAYAEYREFQDELDSLAQKQNAAEVRLAEIDDAINGVENEINRANKDMSIVQTQLAERVVEIYKDGFSSTPAYLEILLSEDDLGAILNRMSVLNKMADQDEELFNQVTAYLDESEAAEADLAEKRQAQTAQMGELQTLQAEMSEKFKASSTEYERLKNQVLALREEVRKAEEAARIAAEKAAAAKAAAAASPRTANSSGGVVASGSFVFPVAGPHSFIDSWGAPRSGGRTHKGTDILAAQGTPLVACVSGTISRVTSTDTGLGGITIWLKGGNGYSYYYAHMDGIASGIRAGVSVSAGQLVGWVGHTGNAGSCNHLHFCMYTSAGAVNPYATLRAND